jgi:signal transduction histidine kinase
MENKGKTTFIRSDVSDQSGIPNDMLAEWQRIVDLMVEIIGVPAGLVMKAHPSEIEVFVASSAEGNPYKTGERIALKTGSYCEMIMMEQTPLLIPDARKDPKWDHSPDLDLGMVSCLGFPLMWPDGTVFGTLCVLDTQKNAYSSTFQELMRQFSATIETDLGLLHEIAEHKRAEEVLERRNRELALLSRVGQEFTAELELQQVAEQLLQAATKVVGTEGASVWLWDEEQEGWLVCRAIADGQSRSELLDMRVRPGQGVVGWVAQKGRSAIVASVPDDPRFYPGVDKQTGFRTVSLLAAPLQVRGTVVGALEMVNKLHGEFDANDLLLVEALAASAAVVIDNARLIETLQERAVELRARNEELDACAYAMAHDLKNSLALLVGFAEIVEEDRTLLLGEDWRHHLRAAARSGRKMSRVVNDLLMLTCVRKMEEIKIESLDMADLVAKAQKRLARMIEEYQVEFVLPDTWPVALGQGPCVEEVWVNYLSNAIKYGGRPPRVELDAAVQADGTVRFSVRDNGSGITPEERDRLFTPFTRLDQANDRGYGLGLAIVRRIVEKLGGQVGVESESDAGSLFWFTLPA